MTPEERAEILNQREQQLREIERQERLQKELHEQGRRYYIERAEKERKRKEQIVDLCIIAAFILVCVAIACLAIVTN